MPGHGCSDRCAAARSKDRCGISRNWPAARRAAPRDAVESDEREHVARTDRGVSIELGEADRVDLHRDNAAERTVGLVDAAGDGDGRLAGEPGHDRLAHEGLAGVARHVDREVRAVRGGEGPAGKPLVAGGHQAALLVHDADRGKRGGGNGVIGDEAGDVDGGAALGVLAPDVAGDGVGAVDGANGELLESDREVRVAIDRGGDRLTPLEPGLGDHRDPHQADGDQTHGRDDGIRATQPARSETADRGFELWQIRADPGGLSWLAAAWS